MPKSKPQETEAPSRHELAARITQEHVRGTSRWRGRTMLVVVAVALVCSAALVWVQWRAGAGAAAQAPAHASDAYGFVLTPALADDANDDEAADAELVLYEDFLCASCQTFHEDAGDYLAEQVAAGAISLEYRPIAFLTNTADDEYSERAANAAACVADDAGVVAYVAMHDLLLTHQPDADGAGLSDDELAEYATEAGAGDVSGCIDDRTFVPWLDEAIEAASEAGIDETPTVQYDGQKVVRTHDGEKSMPGTDELTKVIEGDAS